MFMGILLSITIPLALSIAWIVRELSRAPVLPNKRVIDKNYRDKMAA